MRIEQLKQIQAVAEAGSINKAAKALYISQSNLSQSIKSLEAEAGREIFRRTARGVELTPFGCEFLNLSRAVNSQIRLLDDFCQQTRRRTALRFCVASQYMRFTHTLFVELYQRYRNNRLDFSFWECSFLDIVEHVASQRADLGLLLVSREDRSLTLQLFKNKGLICHPIAQYPAAVTVGPKNPLYHADVLRVTLEDMLPYPIILYRDMNYNYTTEMELFSLNDRDNRIEVSDRATLHEFIQTTDAYSIAAYTGAYESTQYYANIRAIPLDDARLNLELCWIQSQSRPLSPIAKEYVGALKALLVKNQ
ncbi:MAG: LysR family transcriptional regulator [Eubacteriales bacterium]|nr:LysR family transcriptional regulator [Eubacteriales bacterium]